MEQTIKAEEQDLRRVVSQARHEPGLNALLRLAELRRARALESWRNASGTDLVKYQTEYNSMQAVLDMIQKAPREFKIPGRDN
jgi:hypothetical protein